MTLVAYAPVDQATRAELLTELDRTYFIEAGAGTGKTTAIVGRIVRLVATGRVTMEHLAAITFTEAAAAELRDRVREGLERAAANGEHPETERGRCLRAVEEIDLAAISTIHSFAGGLLRTYPLEAGLPPGFRTLDEIEHGVLFEDRFKAWFWGTVLEEPARGVVRRALLLGLSQERLRELAAALEGNHDLLTPETTWPADAPLDALAVAHAAGRSLLDLEAWTAYALDGTDDPLVKTVATAQVAGRRLVQASTDEQALAALVALGKLNATSGTQARWTRLPDGRNGCAATKAVLKEINQRVEAALLAARGAVFADVLALLRDFVLDGARQRKRDGVATFQDLLAWARDLLRDHPEVRRRAQRRIQRLFVDEFQDTDPLQAEIAFYLAADEQSDQPLPADWRDTPLTEGKLCVVGDPKQSIYRFRRADIAVYDALRRRMVNAQAHLVQNFRSLRPVLDWVNHHFAEHMVEQEGEQPPYALLEARWESFGDGAACGVYRVGAQVDENAAGVAALEASALARLARAAVEDGWRVSVSEPTAEGTGRPARYRDVAILLPTTTHLRRLERSLEQAGVPYRVESGTLLLATQEVRDLLTCLRAIEDPSDQVALVAALRSPAYACSDVDLVRWVEGGGRLDYERPGQGPAGPVQAALASLASFSARRKELSPPALIERFIAERLLVGAAFAEPRPRDTWRRLRYVVGRARAFTATGRHTLRSFLDWIDGLQRAEVRDAESADAEPDEDAVRILTVHRSKGLEFPIVLLAGLGASRHGGPGGVELIPDRFTGRLACSAGQGWQTGDFEPAKTREKAMEAAERVRLLYVATTRAKDHLVLSLYRGEKSDSSHAARIEQQLESFGGVCARLEVPDDAAGQASGLPAAQVLNLRQDATVDEQAWLARRTAQIQQFGTAPGAMHVADPEVPGDALADGLDGGTDDADGVRRLVHRSFRTGMVRASGRDEAVTEQRARAILANPVVQRARSAVACRHDVPILAVVNGEVVDLRLDLVVQREGGWELVFFELEGRAFPEGTISQAFALATGLQAVAVHVVRVTDQSEVDIGDAAVHGTAEPANSAIGGPGLSVR